LFGDARNQPGAEIFDKAFTGAQGERANQLREVRLLGRTQHRFDLLHQLADLLSQGQCPRRGHQTASGPDQQRIASGFAQSRASARLIADGLRRKRLAARRCLLPAAHQG
jgi:hypothetical protein